MPKPKTEIKTKAYFDDSNELFSNLSKEAYDPKRLEKFLRDILTDSEIKMLKRRWFVANLINEGHTVREAAEIARVGTDTVMRVLTKIKKGSGVLRDILLSKIKTGYRGKLTKKEIYNKKKKTNLTKWFFGVK